MSEAANVYLSDDEYQLPIVIDPGSFTFRAGFSNSDAPGYVHRNVVAKTQAHAHGLVLVGGLSKGGASGAEGVVGEEVLKRELESRRPVVGQRVEDMEAMGTLLRHMYGPSGLRAASSDHPVIMAVPPRMHNHDKEDITELLFDQFSVPSLYLASAPALVAINRGVASGLILDCGYEQCTATPVFESVSIPHASRRTDLSSAIVEDAVRAVVKKAAAQRNQTVDLTYPDLYKLKSEMQILGSGDEYASQVEGAEAKDFGVVIPGLDSELPVGKELRRVSEGFFQSRCLDMKANSLVKIVTNAVAACDPELKQTLLENIILCGGGSLMKGMAKRLERELSVIYQDLKLHIYKVPVMHEQDLSMVFFGADSLTAFSYFDDLVMKRSEYEEFGPYAIRRKCAVI